MQVTNTYTDDKLPCIEFNHNGVGYELMWTTPYVAAALTMVEEGKADLVDVLGSCPSLLDIINNPFNPSHEDFDGMDENEYAQGVLRFQYCTGVGYLTTECKKS